ncbi:DUF421 domain-containing protein [Brockia lithotrophica]|uniref:Uncharacterized membrane protein YcaP (DUF421 family) n=1 Tax=Brockia lithotrophica TaxID=933949 RepID=A0A660L4T6_9BACL|nr:DUF421 domain-containing protein [Brockia lithotrophica]RKQ89051.1 uncharacterized membrane protein YcaP (DUF421 family) [Brockia lithotrophica]
MEDFLRMLVRSLIMYAYLMFIIRLMGKREIGQVSLFDLVVSIVIAEIAAFTIDDLEMPLYHGLGPILLLALTQIVISYASMKSRRFRDFVDGKPSILIERGKIRDREMRAHRYNIDDLFMQLREKDILDVSEVEFAYLEPSGKLSVVKKPERQPLTPEDLGIPPKVKDVHPLPVIMDGEVITENLKRTGKDERWLREELRARGIARPEDVFLMTLDREGTVYLDLKDEAECPPAPSSGSDGSEPCSSTPRREGGG